MVLVGMTVKTRNFTFYAEIYPNDYDIRNIVLYILFLCKTKLEGDRVSCGHLGIEIHLQHHQ